MPLRAFAPTLWSRSKVELFWGVYGFFSKTEPDPVKRTQILIAGAGPVGATAAYRLAQAGLDVLLLEALPGCPQDMRASTMHPPTLDMMASLGVFEELDAQGLRAPVYHYRNRKSGAVVAFDLTELGDVCAYPFRLQCEQYKLTRLLTGKLEEKKPGSVLFAHRVLAFEQDSEGVTVKVETPMAIETFRADYLIGADGANSTIRKWTGTEFEGFTYPERFLTLSTRYPIEKHFGDMASVNYFADSEEWFVLLRVPEFWRVLVPTDPAASDAELLSDANKDDVFRRLLGEKIDIETGHRTLYRVHQRVAKSFRDGRVLLVGDAAHLNNPLGGFGMNSGIHDIWNLTDKLLSIYNDHVDADAALDLFARQRRAVAQSFVQTQTIANKKMMEAANGNGSGKTEQEVALQKIADNPEERRRHLWKQAMYNSLEQEASIR